jgi:hypothetical protein
MKVTVKQKFRAPQLKLVHARGKRGIQSQRKNAYEIPWETPDDGELRMQIPAVVDPDSAVGQQISLLLRRDISEGLDLGEFDGKDAFLLLAPKRSSGGKFGYTIEAVLAPAIVERAAESLRAIPHEATTSTQ